jgi:hypothetical protein
MSRGNWYDKIDAARSEERQPMIATVRDREKLPQ